MLKTLEDKVFGKLEYRHSWIRKEILKWNNVDCIVKLIAQAYTGDDVLESQRNMYLEYVKNIDSIISKAMPILNEYCKETFKIEILSDDDLFALLTPKTILFERDNSWGILFDLELDDENGIAFFIIDNEIKVGPQELFL